MIMPHSTGHVIARDGCLLRVDIMAGRWVASRLNPNLVITHQVLGSDEAVHRQIKQWLSAPSRSEAAPASRSRGCPLDHRPHQAKAAKIARVVGIQMPQSASRKKLGEPRFANVS
jgi:hypothetical protein